ncbi:MAG: carbohydrate ABC transporter permease [Chloroflexi bacterium]|nr:carbohydrate ABC transporter permease [Chloroflexota bacterium]
MINQPKVSSALPASSIKTVVGENGLWARTGRVLMYLFLGIGAFVSLFPFYFMFIAATHTSSEVLRTPPNLLPGSYLFDNLTKLIKDVGFDQAIYNSILIAVIFTVASMTVSSLAGFAFAKYKFKGSNFVFGAFLLTLMIPAPVTYVPLFKLMTPDGNPFGLNWLGTLQAVILPGLASPFGIFLMRQSMRALPDELLDAGRIDGTGEFEMFWKIVLPVMRPTLAALAIFTFMTQWNSFFWPLVAQVKTIPTAISALRGSSIIDYGGIMTGTSLSVLPILIIFLLMQREFISGALAGSVKG